METATAETGTSTPETINDTELTTAATVKVTASSLCEVLGSEDFDKLVDKAGKAGITLEKALREFVTFNFIFTDSGFEMEADLK